MKSLGKNIFYSTLLSFFNIVYPLLTASYVSRILGAQNIGILNYSQSVVNFLLVFAMLGISTYGVKEIASVRDNQKEKEKVFSELFFIKFYSSIIVYVFYIFLVFSYNEFSQNFSIFFIMSFLLLANIFNLDWFFIGIEDYKILSVRNVVTKILTFLGIIFFVKNKMDINLYTILLVLGQVLGNIWTFLKVRKEINLKFRNLNYRRHYKPLMVFFFSAFIISIYSMVNGILVGMFSSAEKVAFFNRARQLQMIGITVAGVVINVLIPRVSYYYKNDKEKYYEYLKKSLNFGYIFSIPLAIILIFLSKEVNIFLGGEEFSQASTALVILSPLIPIVTVGTWIYLQILVPAGMEKLGILSQLIMAIISTILNFLLIPKYHDIGAAISITISETIGPIFLYFILKRKKMIFLTTNSFYKYFLSGLLMIPIIELLRNFIKGNFKIVMLATTTATFIYFIFLLILKEEITISVLKKIKEKFYEKIR